ncbi:MAG: hypothetical protein ACLP0B_07485 [Steroidobacteraceae bacterium]|jgi:hypothetical protein
MFKRFFSGNKKAPPRIPVLTYEQLGGKSLAEIIKYAKELASSGSSTVQSSQDISRRLVDITYFADGVAPDDRVTAEKLEAALWADIARALQSNPSELAAREEARSLHIKHGRISGVFSLMHKIRQAKPENVIDEIVRIDNARLLDDFPREPLKDQRGNLIQALIRDRATTAFDFPWSRGQDGARGSLKATNSVIAAGWLVLTRDPTALWIFSAGERQIAGRWLDNYAAARGLLKSMGVASTAASLIFDSEPDTLAANGMILQSCADRTTKVDDTQAQTLIPELGALDLESRKNFLTYIFCLRLWIWKRTLSGVYGAAFFQRVKDANPSAAWPAVTADILDRIDMMSTLSLGDDKNSTGMQYLLVAGFGLDLIDRTKPSKIQDETLRNCAVMFNDELFHFSHYVRFLLSYLVHGESGSDRAYREDSIE